MHKALLSSDQQTWKTPKIILRLIRKMGRKNKCPTGPSRLINLDPCASDDEEDWFATHNITKKHDGLITPWNKFGKGLVYVNSPYKRYLPKWIDKAVEESQRCEIILLCPSRPGSKWWKKAWQTANAVCFFDQRITFVGAPDPAPFPSAFFYWGPNPYKFCHIFGKHGIVEVLSDRIV